ncbi:MAG: hypothetical protein N4A49_14835 [Marinifilaceae bacterium]|jgi:hypothetical protein|nr:hypothetical protein [Marinifilaceae bacterium]
MIFSISLLFSSIPHFHHHHSFTGVLSHHDENHVHTDENSESYLHLAYDLFLDLVQRHTHTVESSSHDSNFITFNNQTIDFNFVGLIIILFSLNSFENEENLNNSDSLDFSVEQIYLSSYKLRGPPLLLT